jgi:hypothetical protein
MTKCEAFPILKVYERLNPGEPPAPSPLIRKSQNKWKNLDLRNFRTVRFMSESAHLLENLVKAPRVFPKRQNDAPHQIFALCRYSPTEPSSPTSHIGEP